MNTEQEINETLFDMWERGTMAGALAMLELMVNMQLIGEPMQELIACAIYHDLIKLKIDDEKQREKIQATQEKLDKLYRKNPD